MPKWQEWIMVGLITLRDCHHRLGQAYSLALADNESVSLCRASADVWTSVQLISDYQDREQSQVRLPALLGLYVHTLQLIKLEFPCQDEMYNTPSNRAVFVVSSRVAQHKSPKMEPMTVEQASENSPASGQAFLTANRTVQSRPALNSPTRGTSKAASQTKLSSSE